MSNEHLYPQGGPQSPETPIYTFDRPDSQLDNMERKAIAELAYRMWEARGRPLGSSEEDWYRAESTLRTSREWRLRTESRSME
jgi:hypothetical protein